MVSVDTVRGPGDAGRSASSEGAIRVRHEPRPAREDSYIWHIEAAPGARMIDAPKFPLTVQYSDGEAEVVESEEDACCQLEWLDSDDPENPVNVTDCEGRRVRLKIVALQITVCELQQ